MVEVTCRAAALDRLGMVVDFGLIKVRVGGWINAHLDHNVILNHDDPLAKLFRESTPEQLADPNGMFACKTPHVMSCNPTAENIAAEIMRRAIVLLPESLEVVAVRVWETPNCYAEVVNR